VADSSFYGINLLSTLTKNQTTFLASKFYADLFGGRSRMDAIILSGVSSKGSTFERQFVKVDIIQELIEFLGYQDIAKKS
jgi:hypothetical protein